MSGRAENRKTFFKKRNRKLQILKDKGINSDTKPYRSINKMEIAHSVSIRDKRLDEAMEDDMNETLFSSV